MKVGRGGTSRRRRGARLARLGVGIGLLGSLLVPSAALAIDEFPVGIAPGGITTGPDGALWFTEEGDPVAAISFIGRLTTSGQYSHIQLPSPGSRPDQIIAGPDGNLWFTEVGGNRIGRIVPSTGQLDEFGGSGTGAGGQPQGITVGPDNALWYTAASTNSIRRIDTAGNFGVAHTIPTPASDPSDIELGPDGRLWFTEQATHKIGALNITTGAFQEYPVTPGAEPSGIVATTGGILWFTEPGIGAIGRITTDGTITEYPGAGTAASAIAAAPDGALYYTLGYAPPLPTSPPCTTTDPGDHAVGRITSGGTFTNKFATPTPKSDPADITLGPDGAIWFSEFCANKIGRIAVAAPPPPPPPPVAVLSMSSLRLSPSKFRAAPKGGSVSAKKKKGKTGTRVSYTLNQVASTRFTVERVERGRKSGKKCVKAKRGKKGRKCNRYVRVKGSFKHAGKGGNNTLRFSGRVGSKRLRPGKYRLNAVATSGTSKSKVRRANFKIVR